jgi:hypothetical protein
MHYSPQRHKDRREEIKTIEFLPSCFLRAFAALFFSFLSVLSVFSVVNKT